MSRAGWLRHRWRVRRARHVTFFDAYPDMQAGAQRMLAMAARELPGRGWTTDVVLPGPGQLVTLLGDQDSNVVVEPVPAALARSHLRTTPAAALRGIAALPWYWWRLGRRLAQRRGVVHVQDHRGLILAGPAALIARRPLVWHVLAIRRGPRVNRIGAALADRVAISSRTALAHMPELDRDGKVVAVANVFESARVASSRTASTGRTIVSFGRLHPDKGYDVLLRAVHLARSHVADLQLIIAGGPQDGHEGHVTDLASLSAELGLEGCVTFAGFVERPVELLERAAVYVQSSHESTELLPLAVLEAMASAIPVVSTSVGAISDVIVDGETGLLVPPGAPTALAAAITRVLLDDAFAESLGAAGAARVRTAYTAERIVDDLIALYSPLAGGA